MGSRYWLLGWAAPGPFGRRVGALLLAARVPRVWSGLVRAGAGRGGSRCPVASGADGFAACGRGCWVRWPVVVGSVAGVWPGRGPGSNPPIGSSGWAAGRGMRCVMLCGARGSRGVAGWGGVSAAGIRASALVGWRRCVLWWGWASDDVPYAPSFPPRFLEGLPQALEDIRVVLGCGELAGVDSLGMERIGQHNFPCVPRHPSPRRLESTVLRRLHAEPADQALDRGLRRGTVPQLPQLRVGRVLPPQSTGGSVALGVGVAVGVGGCGGGMGTGGGGLGGVLVVMRRGGARGVRGARAHADTWIRGYGLCLGVGLGCMRAEANTGGW